MKYRNIKFKADKYSVKIKSKLKFTESLLRNLNIILSGGSFALMIIGLLGLMLNIGFGVTIMAIGTIVGLIGTLDNKTDFISKKLAKKRNKLINMLESYEICGKVDYNFEYLTESDKQTKSYSPTVNVNKEDENVNML